MKSLLLVIDLQNAFINKYTKNLPKKINDLINTKHYDDIVFTKFINSDNSIFVEKLKYNGCINDKGGSYE